MQLEMSHNSLHFWYHKCAKTKDWGDPFGIQNFISFKDLQSVPFQLQVYFSFFVIVVKVSKKVISVSNIECSISVKWIRKSWLQEVQEMLGWIILVH